MDSLTMAALEWLEDCFEDMPEDLTTNEVWAAIARHYQGGIAQFKADA